MTSNQQVAFHSLSTLLCSPKPLSYLVAFDASHSWCWQSLLSDIDYNSKKLQQSQAKKVALCCSDSYQFAVGFFAIACAGKSIVLPGNHQPEALIELSQQFDLLFCDGESDVSEHVRSMNIDIATPSNSMFSYSPLALDEISLILFTSGSSGKPKAINKTLHQLDTEIAILEQLWGEQVQYSRIESTVSHQHIYGLLFRVLWPLCAGRAFACRNLEYPEQIASHASSNTTLISSPALLKRLSLEDTPSTLTAIFSSGGPLSFAAAQHALQLYSQSPIEVFGSTETGGIAFRQQHTSEQLWQLFPSVKAQLDDEQCLQLCSPHINGTDWYQTSDRCYFHDAVHFRLLGRADRIIKVEEKRVSLVEVENRLDHTSWVNESTVIPLEENGRLILAAAIVLTEEGTDKLQQLGKGKFWIQLRNELRAWLEPVAIPRKYRVLNDIPVNSQGKKQFSQIEALFKDKCS